MSAFNHTVAQCADIHTYIVCSRSHGRQRLAETRVYGCGCTRATILENTSSLPRNVDPLRNMDLPMMEPLSAQARILDCDSHGLWAGQYAEQDTHGLGEQWTYVLAECALDREVPDGVIMLPEPTKKPPTAFSKRRRMALAWHRLIGFPEEPMLGTFSFADLDDLKALFNVSN